MKVKVKLSKGAKAPERKTGGASGWDISAHIEKPITLNQFEIYTFPTGVHVELPPGTEYQARIRSGLSSKHGFILMNGVGTIDEDYRGEIKLTLMKLSNGSYTFEPGERIGQVILAEYISQEIEIVEELNETKRGNKGFGHTGK